jgi:hypothetical protein
LAYTVYAYFGGAGGGNWDAASAWTQNADGSGDVYTNPQNGTPEPGDTYICVLNSKAVVLSATCGDGSGNVTVDAIQAPAADTGSLTTTGSHNLNVGASNGIVYGHTSTAGMLIVPTGDSLTINGQAVNQSSGYGIVAAGTASVTINNVGLTALSNSGTGRGFSGSQTGALTINGNVVTSNGYAIAQTGNAASVIDGSVTHTGGLAAIYITSGSITINTGPCSSDITTQDQYGIVRNSATVTFNCNLKTTNFGGIFYNDAAGTCNWTGNRTLGVGENLHMRITSGTLNLATAGAKLALANSGSFALIVAGTPTINYSAAGGDAKVTDQSAAAHSVVLGNDTIEAALLVPYAAGGGGGPIFGGMVVR